MNVGEFSRRAGVSAHTVRYYEKLGLLGSVRRQTNGHRFFSGRDLEWIGFVQRLKETGMPLDRILEYARLRAAGDGTLAARRRLLKAHADTIRDAMARQQRHLDKLEEKIAHYRQLDPASEDA